MDETASTQPMFAKVTNSGDPDVSIRLAQPTNDNTFTKFHLGITSRRFFEIEAAGTYDALVKKNADQARLTVARVEDPTASDFLYHLQKVGEKYGWDKRKKYQPDNLDAIQAMMEERQSELYIFLANGKEVGFCMTAGIDKNRPTNQKRPYEKGIEKSKAVNMFLRECQKKDRTIDPTHAEPIEIYKIGLYDGSTGKGYGNYFLHRMLDILFDKKKYDLMYLDTRSTNHSGVLKFYKQNGVDVFHQEILPSDLVPIAPTWQKQDDYHAVVEPEKPQDSQLLIPDSYS